MALLKYVQLGNRLLFTYREVDAVKTDKSLCATYYDDENMAKAELIRDNNVWKLSIFNFGAHENDEVVELTSAVGHCLWKYAIDSTALSSPIKV